MSVYKSTQVSGAAVIVWLEKKLPFWKPKIMEEKARSFFGRQTSIHGN